MGVRMRQLSGVAQFAYMSTTGVPGVVLADL
jgi:hypothetical protein